MKKQETIYDVIPGISNYQPNIQSPAVNIEPPSEEVLLPSRGIFYTDDNKVIKENNGKIKIKPFTFKEECILVNPRIVKTGQIIDAILESVIRTPNINVKKLMSSDRVFLFFYVRSISYGDDYEFTMSCVNCNERFNYIIKISELNIVYADEKTHYEPYEVILPVSKKKILFRYSRGEDEIVTEAPMRGEFEKIEEQLDVIKDLVRLTVDIEGIPKNMWYKFYENLSIRDVREMRTQINNKNFGIDTSKTITCPLCRTNFVTTIPITPNFFLLQ